MHHGMGTTLIIIIIVMQVKEFVKTAVEKATDPYKPTPQVEIGRTNLMVLFIPCLLYFLVNR